MQKILDFIASKTFRNAACFILFTLLMTVIISSQNFFFQKVIENGISKKDIVAQKDIKVIDTVKTERHKKEVAQNVEPILTQAEDEFITTSLITLQNSVKKIREKDVSDEIKTDELNVLFDEAGKKGLVEFLLKANDEDLQSVFDKSKITLASVLNAGVSNKDFDNNNVAELIKKNLPNNVPRYQGSLIAGILNQIIVPNLVVDEFATEIARKNAQNAVKPYEVVFKKGQKIVFEGEPVTKLKRDALRAAGYNVLEINYGGILGMFLLIAFFTFVFLQYEKNFEKQYYNAKYMTIMSSFTLILAFISGFCGCLLGVVVTRAITKAEITFTNDFLIQLFGGEALVTAVTASNMLWIMFLMFCLGILGWIYPVITTLKVQPIEAIQGTK